jgi:hypothetical protein
LSAFLATIETLAATHSTQQMFLKVKLDLRDLILNDLENLEAESIISISHSATK